MNNILKKKIRSATAGILAVAIIVSGTFAWNAFDQEALNEINGEAKGAGARLHDDFNGENKDVYIENYADEGGELVFARIRLDEYMEIGTGAGSGGTDLEVLRGDKEKSAGSIPVVTDVTTWDTYLYGSTPDGSEQIRKYRNLAFGGSAIYMPTFNKHIYNLDADINGTLRGPDGDPLTDGDAYLDYKTYSNGQSLTADAKYATDDQDVNNQRPDDYVTVNETHIAKPTLTSTVMSMEQWKTNGCKPGPYWVYDVDGWAYWAQGIEPQTATGLLLTGITEVESPDDEWYYAVNVVSQMATVNDWGTEEGKDGFYSDGITEDGEHIINQIAGLIQGVSIDVSILSGDVDLQVGDTIELGATVTVPEKYKDINGYSWSIKEVNGNSGLSQTVLDATFQNGLFTPVSSMIGKSYLLTAYADLNYKVRESILVYVYDNTSATITISTSENESEVGFEQPVQLISKVQGLSSQSVTWSLIGGTGTTSINQSGLLVVDELQEGGSILTVQATSVIDNRIIGEKEIRVTPTFKNVNPGSDVFVKADNIDWYVLDRVSEDGHEKVMIFPISRITTHNFHGTVSNRWSTSDLRKYLNGSFIDTYLPTLKSRIIDTTLRTPINTNTSGSYDTTTDKVFLLTIEDYGFASNAVADSNPTNPNALVSVSKIQNDSWVWTRSPNTGNYVSVIMAGGKLNIGYTTSNATVRPAMWIEI